VTAHAWYEWAGAVVFLGLLGGAWVAVYVYAGVMLWREIIRPFLRREI